MKHTFSRSWKSLVSAVLVIALLGTTIHTDLIQLSWNWLETSGEWAAQTITRGDSSNDTNEPETPSGPQCVDVANLSSLIMSTVGDLKQAEQTQEREEAFASEGRVPEELTKPRERVPHFNPRDIDTIISDLEVFFAEDQCQRASADSAVADQARSDQAATVSNLSFAGVDEAELVTVPGEGLAYNVVIPGRPPVEMQIFLCSDGKFRSADGILEFPDDEGLIDASMRDKIKYYKDILLQKVLTGLPDQNYSRDELTQIFNGVNAILGDTALDIGQIETVFERNGGKEVAVAGGRLFFLDELALIRGRERANLSIYDLSESQSYNRIKTWRNNDFSVIDSLPRELREWAKEQNASNVLTKDEVAASAVLTDLRNQFMQYSQGSSVTRREEWTLIQQTQYKNYTTIQEARNASGKTSLSFIIDPHTQHISIYGDGKVYTFEHVGDNIYEYYPEDGGKPWRWLITGSIVNIQQGSTLFDRISAGEEPPESLVRMNNDGSEWTYPGTDQIETTDLSYRRWRDGLKSTREDENIRIQAERERLSRDFSRQPHEVQLRIRQLEILQQDLLAYRTEVENAAATRFAAFIRQSYAKYHPLGENGLGVFDFGGSESNFKERISSMVNLFIDLYLVPQEPSHKSRLQELLEEYPWKSVQDILTEKNDDGTGRYIRDPAMFEFINNIFLNYSAGFLSITHYKYEDPKTQADLDEDQLRLLERLSGTFFDDYDPAENGSLEDWLETAAFGSFGRRFIESIAGKRQFVQFEAQVFDMLDTEINQVIARHCASYELLESFRQDAARDVEDSLNADAKDKKGKTRGMTVRDWLRVGPSTQFGTQEMQQVVENMVAQRVEFLQRQCAVKYMLTLKDSQGNVTGGLTDPNKRRAFQLYVKIFDLTNDWFTLSKESWNTIFDEVLINAPLMLISAGAANLVLRAAITGLGRVFRGAMLFAEAYQATSRVARISYRVMNSLYKAQQAGFTILRPVGNIARSLSEGALEGFFEQALSLQTLEEIATGRSRRTGEDWFKAMATEAVFEGVFDLAGGFSRHLFRRTARYRDILGNEQYTEIATRVGRWLNNNLDDKLKTLIRLSSEEVAQAVNAFAIIFVITRATQQSPSGQLDNSVASNILGDQSLGKDALHSLLQVLSFTYGRKIANTISKGTPWAEAFFNGGHPEGIEPGSAATQLRAIRNNIAGVDQRMNGLRNRLENESISEAERRLAEQELSELTDVRKVLESQKGPYEVARISDIDAELPNLGDLTLQEGGAFVESLALNLLQEKFDLQKTLVQGNLASYDAMLQQLSTNIQVFENLKNQPDTDLVGLDAQISEARNQMFLVSQAKNNFSVSRMDQLRDQISSIRTSIDILRTQGSDPAVIARFVELDAAYSRELRELREQRTNVATQAEYDSIVRQQTANGTFQATNAYGHIDLATGRWYVNQAKLRADARALADAVNAAAAINIAQQIRGLNNAQLGRMLALPADPAARQVAIDDLRNQLEENPNLVDAGRGPDGQDLSLRGLLARFQQRNLLEGHVRHEMGHRFERSLDPNTRAELANVLGHDMSTVDGRENFEENIADWLSGDLDAATSARLDDFFRDMIRELNPRFTDEGVERALRDMKTLSSIRENFLANYQAEVGVDFQQGDVGLTQPQTVDADKARGRALAAELSTKLRESSAARFFPATEIQAQMNKLSTDALKADFLQQVINLMDSPIFTKSSSDLTADERSQREALVALERSGVLDFSSVFGVLSNQTLGLSTDPSARIYYNQNDLLGRGSFGAVYRGVVIRNGEAIPVAVKTFHTVNAAADHELQISQYLLEQQNALGDQYPTGPIRIEGVSMTRNSQGQLTSGVVAQQLIQPPAGKAIEMGSFEFDSRAQAEQFVIDTFKAIQSVHNLGIAISDIKPQNIGVHQNADGSIRPVVLDPGSWMLRGVPEGTQGVDPSVPVVSGRMTRPFFDGNGVLGTWLSPYSRLTVGNARIGVITTPHYRPARDQSVRYGQSFTGRDALIIDQPVVDERGRPRNGDEIQRTLGRGYFTGIGIDAYSVGLSFMQMITGHHGILPIRYNRDGNLERVRDFESNLGEMLSPDFARKLQEVSEGIASIERLSDGSLRFDQSAEAVARANQLFQEADLTLEALLPAPTVDLTNLIPNQGNIPAPADFVAGLQVDIASAKTALLDRLSKDATPGQRALIEQTFIDPMTGMLNRAGLAFMDNMVSNGQRISVVSFDGDHFGANNEVMGRDFGDALIQLMAKNFHQMINSLREQGHDVHGVRMGGEEFVVFGDIDSQVLRFAMEGMIANLKRQIRDLHTPETLDALATYIANNAYVNVADRDAAFTQSRFEIGGSTAGILQFNFEGTQSQVEAEGGASVLRGNALQYTDQFLERGKADKNGGRGQIYETAEVPDRRENNTERLFGFKGATELADGQRQAMDDLRSELNDQVAADFNARLTQRNAFFAQYGFNDGAQSVINSFLAQPGYDLATAEALAIRIATVSGGADAQALTRTLIELKNEYFQAVRDFGGYTGSATIFRLSNLDGVYGPARQIDLGQFKSINETMGHTHGDTFLIYVYRNIILQTAAELGYEAGDIVVAQKGASFVYRLEADGVTPGLLATFYSNFENAIAANYEQAIRDLVNRLGVDEAGNTYDETRLEWLTENRAPGDGDSTFADRFQASFADATLPAPVEAPDLRPAAPQVDVRNALTEAGFMSPELQAAVDAGQVITETITNADGSPVTIVTARTDDFALGSGGFATVYRGFSVDQNGQVTEVAVKQGVPDFQLDNPREFVEQEAARAEELMRRQREDENHPDILAEVIGVSADRTRVVTELVRGPEGTSVEWGSYQFESPQAAAEFMGHVLEGLLELQAAGLAHFDIKPQNILVSENGFPVIVDNGTILLYGAEGSYGDARDSLTAEATGAFAGSLAGSAAYQRGLLTLIKIQETNGVINGVADFDAFAKSLRFLLSGDFSQSTVPQLFPEGSDARAALESVLSRLEQKLDEFYARDELNPDKSIEQFNQELNDLIDGVIATLTNFDAALGDASSVEARLESYAAENGLDATLLADYQSAYEGGNFQTFVVNGAEVDVYISVNRLSDRNDALLLNGFYVAADGSIVEVVVKGLKEDVDNEARGRFEHEKEISRFLLENAEVLDSTVTPVIGVADGAGDIGDGFIVTVKTPADSFNSLADKPLTQIFQSFVNASRGLQSLVNAGVFHLDIHGENLRSDGGIIDFDRAAVQNDPSLNLDAVIGDLEVDPNLFLVFGLNTEAGGVLFDYYQQTNTETGEIRGINDARASIIDFVIFTQSFFRSMDRSNPDWRSNLQQSNPQAATLLSQLEARLVGTDADIVRSMTDPQANVPTFAEFQSAFQNILNALTSPVPALSRRTLSAPQSLAFLADPSQATAATMRDQAHRDFLFLRDDQTARAIQDPGSDYAETTAVPGVSPLAQTTLSNYTLPLPEPGSDPRNYVKHENLQDYLQQVYNDNVTLGVVDPSQTSFEAWSVSAAARAASAELAYVSPDGQIFFNMSTLRSYAQSQGRHWISIYKELITHENVHRSFNQLPLSVRSNVIRSLGEYFGRMRTFRSQLTGDQVRLFNELAKNLGLTPDQLMTRTFDTAVADEMLATYFGLVRAGEIASIDSLGRYLTNAGLDINNFWKLSHAREAYVGQQYQVHEDAGRRTQRSSFGSFSSLDNRGLVESDPFLGEPSVFEVSSENLQALSDKIEGTAAYKQRARELISIMEGFIDSDGTSFQAYLSELSNPQAFVQGIYSLMRTLENATLPETVELTREVLNAVSDFMELTTDFDPIVSAAIQLGNLGGMQGLRHLLNLTRSTTDAYFKAWYDLQLLRIRRDLPNVDKIFTLDQQLKQNAANFPVDLLPQAAEIARGDRSILDLLRDDGTPFTSMRELLDLGDTLAEIANSPIFVSDTEFSLIPNLDASYSAADLQVLTQIRDLLVGIRRNVTQNGLSLDPIDLWSLATARRSFEVIDNGQNVGTFFTPETDISGEVEGVLVNPQTGDLVYGSYINGFFEAFDGEAGLRGAAPIGEVSDADINVLRAQVLQDLLQVRNLPGDQDLAAAVAGESVATVLQDGRQVFVLPGGDADLGAGGVGSVRRGVMLSEDGQSLVDVAVKSVFSTNSYVLNIADYVRTNPLPGGVVRVYGVDRAQQIIVSDLVTSDAGIGKEVRDYQFASSDQADHFGRTMVEVIQRLHDLGIVVTDIKPSNVLVQVVFDPQTGAPARHDDGSLVVEPRIADLDSFVFRGTDGAFPPDDPRSSLLLTNVNEAANPIGTPFTLPNERTILDTVVDGEVVNRDIEGGGSPFGIVKTAGLIMEKGRYDGADSTAVAWTLMYLGFFDGIEYGSTNFGRVLSPEIRERYLEAIHQGTGFAQSDRVSVTEDGLVETVVSSDAEIVSLGEIAAILNNSVDTTKLKQSRFFRSTYEISPGQTAFVAAGDVNLRITREANGRIFIDDIRSGLSTYVDPGETYTFEGGLEVKFREANLVFSEALQITNNTGFDGRIRILDTSDLEAPVGEPVFIPEETVDQPLPPEPAPVSQEQLDAFSSEELSAVIEVHEDYREDLPLDLAAVKFKLADEKVDTLLRPVRGRGFPIVRFGSSALYRRGIGDRVPADIDLATTPGGLVQIYDMWLSDPDVTIVKAPYLHDPGGPFEALRLEATITAAGQVYSIEIFGEGGTFVRYRSEADGGGVHPDFESVEYRGGLFQLGNADTAAAILENGPDGLPQLSLEAIQRSYRKVLAEERLRLASDESALESATDPVAIEALQKKISERVERMELLATEYDVILDRVQRFSAAELRRRLEADGLDSTPLEPELAPESFSTRLENVTDIGQVSAIDILGGADASFVNFLREQSGGQDPTIVRVDERTGESLQEALDRVRIEQGEEAYVVVHFLRTNEKGEQVTVVADRVSTLLSQQNAIRDYEQSILGRTFDFQFQHTFAESGVYKDVLGFRESLRGRGFGGPVLARVQDLVSSSQLNPAGKIFSNTINFLTARDAFRRFGADLDVQSFYDEFGVIDSTARFLVRIGIVTRADFDRPGQTNLLDATDVAPIQIKDRFFEVLVRKSQEQGLNQLEYILHRFELYSEGKIQEEIANGALTDPDAAPNATERRSRTEAVRARLGEIYLDDFPGIFVTGSANFDSQSQRFLDREMLKRDLLSRELELLDVTKSIELAGTVEIDGLFEQVSTLEAEISSLREQLRNFPLEGQSSAFADFLMGSLLDLPREGYQSMSLNDFELMPSFLSLGRALPAPFSMIFVSSMAL